MPGPRNYRPGLIARLLNAGSWKLTLFRNAPGVIGLENSGYIELPCSGVVAVASTKALLWHTLEIHSLSRVDRLSGLSGDAAAKLAADLKRYANDHLCDLIASDGDRLREIEDKLSAIVGAKAQYLAHADLSRAIASVPGNAAAALSHPMLDPNLAAAHANRANILTRSETCSQSRCSSPLPPNTISAGSERKRVHKSHKSCLRKPSPKTENGRTIATFVPKFTAAERHRISAASLWAP